MGSEMCIRDRYLLRVDPGRVNLAQVLRVIDGPIAPTPCVSINFYVKCDDCEDEVTCALRPIMERVRDANLGVYENTSLLTFQNTGLLETKEIAIGEPQPEATDTTGLLSA